MIDDEWSQDGGGQSPTHTAPLTPADITQKAQAESQYQGIRQAVFALKPYLSRRIRIKFQSVHILEVYPDGGCLASFFKGLRKASVSLTLFHVFQGSAGRCRR